MTTPYQDNQICVATVDYTLGKTKLIWEKTENVGIESYNIYKKVSITNDYNLIGTVPISNEPEFIDMTSNPSSQAYTYKITAVDTCGGESEMSPYHKSIFIVHSEYQGSHSVSISEYEDESGNYIPSQYYLLEDTTGTGSNFRIIDSTIYTLFTNVNPFPGADYLVGISQPFGCGNTKNRSTDNLILSNKLDILVNIEDFEQPKVSIHPNPSSGIFHIDGDYDRVEIFNSIGQQVLLTETRTIDLSSFEKGVYFAKFKNAYGPSIVKKIVLQ